MKEIDRQQTFRLFLICKQTLVVVVVMDMSSCRPMGASVARLVILVSGARSRSWN